MSLRVDLMNRTKVLLLVVGALAVAATIAWQRSFDVAIAVPPPAQLKVPPARATSKDLVPVAATNNVPAVAPDSVAARDAAKSPTRKPSPRVVRQEAPAAVSVERAETHVPPPAAAVVNAPPAREPTADEARNPDAYEANAALSLRQHNYVRAREEFESALAHGGKATFALVHDHTSGNFDKKDPKATCVGELTILANEVTFVAPEDAHRFTAGWTDVRDAGANKFFGSGIGGFHVTITADGKYRNFNLAPESRDKAEGKLILDLLKSHERRQDRTK
jgi:hypothetical protein